MTVTYPIIRFLFSSGDVEFSRTQVKNANLLEQTNIISTEIPINTIDFKLVTLDDLFSMFSESAALLTERLPLLVYEQVDGETLLLGKFYLSTWKNTSDKVMEFSAYDIIGVLDNTDFDGLFWSTPVTLAAALAQVLTPINVAYEIDSSLADVELSGWMPSGSYRDALQQIGFAAGATILTSRRENILITKSVSPTFFYVDRLFSTERLGKQTLELLPIVSTIELVSHNYEASDTVETIFDKYLEAGSYKVIYEKPYYDIVISGPGYTQFVLGTEAGDYLTTENGDYLEAGGEYNVNSNSAYFTISVAGQVTITGHPWIDSKRSYIFNETGTNESQNKKTIKVADATLINTSNGQTILDGMRDYYRLRYVQTTKILPTELETNDIVLSNTVYETNVLVSIQKMDMDLTGGFLSKVEMLGVVPVYVEDSVSPARRLRTGIAVSGAGLTKNNRWRRYA